MRTLETAVTGPMRVVRVPITCCPGCSHPYDLGEYRALPERKPPEPLPDFFDGLKSEWRACPCGETLALITEGIEALDFYVPEHVYRAAWPSSRRRAITVSKPRAAAAVLKWIVDRLGF